jgi:DNA mismatch repair protein MutS
MELTPGMKQYMDIKDKYPDCVIFFRMGDFYETFFEDAKTVSRELDIVLTARGKGEKRAPLAGIPYHALDSYLGKLVKKGYKVCIVEQLEDPKKAKGLVKRGVVRIVTPGTVIEDNLLNKDQNNFIVSINKEKEVYGVTICDITTGEFLTTEVKTHTKLFSEIDKFNPAEIIVPTSFLDSELINQVKNKGYFVNSYDDRFFLVDKCENIIKDHFNVHNLEGYEIARKNAIISSAGALLFYLKETQKNNLSHINTIQNYSVNNFMVIDSATQRNLELLKNIKDSTNRGTLFEVINKTVTSMGSRKLKKWLTRPLIDLKKINKRLNAITELIDDNILKEEIKEILAKFCDLERVTARIIYGTANARDLIALKNSLFLITKLKKLMDKCSSEFLLEIKEIKELKNITDLIEKAIKEEPSLVIKEGNIIKDNYSQELDELRKISSSGKKWINEFEEREREKTGIKNLKIKYNRIFGYFIEVTKSNLSLVPEYYIRKQTQVNCERYFTEELKQKENLILGSQDKINSLEYELFIKILNEVSNEIQVIQVIANKISSLDCLVSLSIVASENNYTKPFVNELDEIEIVSGRHPVIEKIEQSFVDNDCKLNNKTQMMIITGPNMAGKSTYLRQNALIILLSQIGSYVPAKSCTIGIVDRIFSRIGAYDDLSMSQSTFMIEMNETANILNNATKKSFVILDEIGRGTSTYDGFSLAWAIAEYLNVKISAKTLFATHYHQLNKMTEEFPTIKNFNVLVNESSEDIVFLRKIISGGTDKSYGIHVAKLAGLPTQVINKAKVLMGTLEKEDKIMKKLEQEVVSQKKIESSEDDSAEYKREIHITETIKKKNVSKQQTLVDLEK